MTVIQQDAPDLAEVEQLSRSAADWLLTTDALGSPDPSLYHGLCGIVLALHEARVYFDDDRYDTGVERGLDELSARIDTTDNTSLYFGLAGMAFCLHRLGREAAAGRALLRIRDTFDGERWGPMFELLMGNAGIGLGALHAGDLELAVRAVLPYVEKADRTAHGVNWAVRPTPPRSHHMAHGTLGIACALASVGSAADRDDLAELAVLAAEDVVSRNTAGPAEFLVPHSDPAAPAGHHRALQLRLVQRAGRRCTALSAALAGHRGRAVGGVAGPLLDHCYPLRPSRSVATGLLGQQRPMLRDRWRARDCLRPHRRTR